MGKKYQKIEKLKNKLINRLIKHLRALPGRCKKATRRWPSTYGTASKVDVLNVEASRQLRDIEDIIHGTKNWSIINISLSAKNHQRLLVAAYGIRNKPKILQ